MCEEHKILPTISQKDTISHLLLLGIKGKNKQTKKPETNKQTNQPQTQQNRKNEFWN